MVKISKYLTIGFVFLLFPVLGCKKQDVIQQNSQNDSLHEVNDVAIVVPKAPDSVGDDSNRFDSERFDQEGFDREGFNRLGFDRHGYDREGFNRYGFNRLGFNRHRYDREGFNRHGFNRLGLDRYGYNRQGFDHYGYDQAGFDQMGFNRVGFDREGYNREGFDRDGYNRRGFNRYGHNRQGFDHYFFNGLVEAWEFFNREEFDREGYNRQGFDHEGFDRAGVDQHGLNRNRLQVQPPRGVWSRLQQDQQTVWDLQERDWFAGLQEYEEDQIIREKINQLNLNKNQTVEQFLNIVNQNNNLSTSRFLDKIAELILNVQVAWNQMNPNLDQVIQLASSIPGSTVIQNGTIWELKRNALARGLVQNGEDFQQLLGAIPANLVQNPYFLEARTTWFIDSLPIILGLEGLSFREMNDLKVLTQNMRFYPDLNDQKDRLMDLIDQALGRIRAEFPIRELDLLNARVQALYNQVRPTIGPQSKFKFYLIRDQAEWANDRVAQDHGHGLGHHHHHEEPCLICAEELNHDHPGVTCPMHPYIAYHASEDCLIPHVRNQIIEQRFPITCGDLDNPHELPITEELLRNAGLEEQQIRAWKIQTLRSYYAELIRLQNGGVAQTNPNPAGAQVYCATPDCGAIIFTENVRAETQTHVCDVCAVQRCHRCGELPHPGQACGRADREAIPPPDSLYRPCPYCLTITDRLDGCNSIRCQNQNCRREWHFNMGKPRTRSFTHDFEPNVNQPRPREYRVPGDVDYVEGQDMECAFPDHEGEIIR